MEDIKPNHFEYNLKDIKETIVAEVPSYLESMGGSWINNNSEDNRITYKVVDCSVKLLDQLKLGFHAASIMYEAEIRLEEQTADRKSQSLHCVIVKMMPTKEIMRHVQNSTDQFFNESKMFAEIIPLLLETCSESAFGDSGRPSYNLSAACDLFPKCFYVSHDPLNAMIVLEDLRTAGYRIGGNKAMLMDYDHIVLALKGLARFHALSYGMKKKDLQRFEDHISTQIRDARRFVKKQTSLTSLTVGYQLFLRHTTMALLDKFQEKHLEEGGLYEDKIRGVRERIEDCVELFREILTPEEPLAVLCHGDFNMNNMLFRYDSNNKPSGVKFIDFQNPFYASPAIDLSFFLFVNVSPEVMASHWDDFFSTYHRTLLDALSEFLGCPQEALLPEFSLDAFKDQFSRYALYGFILATSFVMGSGAKPGDEVSPFEVYSKHIPSLEELNNFIKKNFKLVNVEVIERLLPLTQKLLDKITL